MCTSYLPTQSYADLSINEWSKAFNARLGYIRARAGTETVIMVLAGQPGGHRQAARNGRGETEMPLCRRGAI